MCEVANVPLVIPLHGDVVVVVTALGPLQWNENCFCHYAITKRVTSLITDMRLGGVHSRRNTMHTTKTPALSPADRATYQQIAGEPATGHTRIAPSLT